MSKIELGLLNWREARVWPEYMAGILEGYNTGGISVLEVLLTGSAHVCRPPVNNTDVDVMILVSKDKKKTMARYLIDARKFEECGASYDNDDLIALRREAYNLLIVDSKRLFYAWQVATDIATRLNLTNKAHRIVLFDRITQIYGLDQNEHDLPDIPQIDNEKITESKVNRSENWGVW